MNKILSRCYICGIELEIVNNKLFCKNCGFIESESKESEESNPSYIG